MVLVTTAGPNLSPRLVETHTAVLLFLADRVYKLKKPVDLAFLDFRSPAARQRACAEEVRLNRRLTPDVYLGVADVTGPDGALCDHLVVMRRLPAQRRLATLIASGAPVDEPLRQVARKIAAFHARGPAVEDPGRFGGPAAVARLWQDTFARLQPHASRLGLVDVLDRCRRLSSRYLRGRGPLFTDRVARGHVVDGHGDLLADDIFCLDDGPRILDCLDFDERLRIGDVLLDVAFLAMDLERLGAPAAATTLLRDYREYAAETHPPSLEDFYIAYRALVRTLVCGIRAEQGHPDAPAEARVLAELCRTHLERARTRLVLVGGLPGTGKSTVATALADRDGWALGSSDIVRKQLHGISPTTPAPAGWEQGLYTPDATARTYHALLDRAHSALPRGESVVLDATWRDSRWRTAARELADATTTDLIELCCTADPATATARLRDRGRAGPHPSDATVDVQARMTEAADAWPTATLIDTTRPPPHVLIAARAAAGVTPHN